MAKEMFARFIIRAAKSMLAKLTRSPVLSGGLENAMKTPISKQIWEPTDKASVRRKHWIDVEKTNFRFKTKNAVWKMDQFAVVH